MIATEDLDPYEISNHQSGDDGDCDENIFTEDGESFLSDDEMSEKDCLACWHLWGVIQDILTDVIERAGDDPKKEVNPRHYKTAIWLYDMAQRAFAIADYFDTFRPRAKEVTLWEWNLFQIVGSEKQKRAYQKALQQKEAAKQPQG